MTNSTPATLTSPIVGSYHRPLASVLLKYLLGCELILSPEPDNPYDSSAIKVLVNPLLLAELPQDQVDALASELPGSGYLLEELMSSGPVHLGYIAATGGKPLAKAQEAAGGFTRLSGNQEVLDWLKNPNWSARMDFGLDGKPVAVISVSK